MPRILKVAHGRFLLLFGRPRKPHGGETNSKRIRQLLRHGVPFKSGVPEEAHTGFLELGEREEELAGGENGIAGDALEEGLRLLP